MSKKFKNTIETAINKKPTNQTLANVFLSGKSNCLRYVIGKNEQSAMLIKNFKIDGLIDDYSETQAYLGKVPVIKSSDVPKDSIVVNCSSSISPVTVGKKLCALGIRNILNLHEIIFTAKNRLSFPEFVMQMRDNYNRNAHEWIEIYKILSDEESKKTFLDIICYRLTANPFYMRNYSVRLNEQYFENFMNYSDEVFVDIGGFDGDTTEEFCKRYPCYKKVFIFEPSSINMACAKKRLANYNRIEYVTAGLSDKPGVLSFNQDAGSASAINENGNNTIEVTTLDIRIKEAVTFIKMDIEGWENNALIGSQDHITHDHPKLAIATYHKASDFHEIPKYILSLNPKYKLYLRHYTEGWSETVMYFLPDKPQ